MVSANRSVMTDLTEEVFDAPPPHNAPALDATEAARLYAGYDPANRAQSYRQAPPSLPRRLPLYNGSDDASSPGKHTASPGNSDFTPSLRGEEVHPSVESFLASAMRNVRLNRSHSNLDDDGEDDDRPPTSDEEEKSAAEERRHRSDRRKSGGVNSTDSSGSDWKGGGGSKRREKRSHGSSGGGRRKGKGSSSSRPAAEQGFQSDPGSRRSPAERLGARVVSVPTKGGGGRGGAAPQRRRSRSDVPSKSRRRHATPPRKSAPAKGGASPGTRRRSMRSYASADDDDDSFGESTDDSDPLESLRFGESDF